MATKKVNEKKKYMFMCETVPFLWVSYLKAQFMNGIYETDSEEVAQELKRYPQIREVEKIDR